MSKKIAEEVRYPNSFRGQRDQINVALSPPNFLMTLLKEKWDPDPIHHLSMPEMSVARKDHCHVGGVGSGNHLFVAHRTAWLDTGGGSGVNRGL